MNAIMDFVASPRPLAEATANGVFQVAVPFSSLLMGANASQDGRIAIGGERIARKNTAVVVQVNIITGATSYLKAVRPKPTAFLASRNGMNVLQRRR